MHGSQTSTSAGGRAQPYRVLIAGGGYAAVSAALSLADRCAGKVSRLDEDEEGKEKVKGNPVSVQITMVSDKDGFYHLIGNPLSLVSTDYAKKAWMEWKDIPSIAKDNIKLVRGVVSNVDMEAKSAVVELAESAGTKKIDYDYFIAATGLDRTSPSAPKAITKAGYLDEMGFHIEKVQNSQGVVVVGGGAVGIEIAAEIKARVPGSKVVLIHSRGELMSAESFSDEFRQLCLTELKNEGVEVMFNARVSDIAEKDGAVEVKLEDGTVIKTGHAIWALSKQESTGKKYLPGSTLDEDGYVAVSETLQFKHGQNRDYHFAAGDLAAWPRVRRCGAAMHFGNIATNNLYQHMLGRDFQGEGEYRPHLERLKAIPPMMAIAIGHSAASYHPDMGVSSGAAALERFFNDDLGLGICWRHMGLGQGSDEPVTVAEKTV